MPVAKISLFCRTEDRRRKSGEWMTLPDFNDTKFGTLRNSAGSNHFGLAVKQRIEYS